MSRHWTEDDEKQKLEAREIVARQGRWSGGVYLPADKPETSKRPSIISQMLRSMSEIHSS
jgi:hypothetical protein